MSEAKVCEVCGKTRPDKCWAAATLVGELHCLRAGYERERAAREKAEAERDAAKARKDDAYAERDQCVALIAKMAIALGWRAGLRDHEDKPGETWEADWRTLVCIDLPTGQVSWHFHDSERHLLSGMPNYTASWDGHDTAEKYRRVNACRPELADLAQARKERDAASEDARQYQERLARVTAGAVAHMAARDEAIRLLRGALDRGIFGACESEPLRRRIDAFLRAHDSAGAPPQSLPAWQRAQHTCNAADGSMHCRGCAAGIPYPRLPEEQAFLDALAPAQPATGRSEDEAEKLADALLGARLGPCDLVAALRAALAAAERRGLERAAQIVELSDLDWDRGDSRMRIVAAIRAAEPEKKP